MDPSKLSEAELIDVLEKANEAYHNTGTPLISDDYYDALKQRLQKIHPKHPFFKNVGAPPRGEKVKLPYYLGSMDKIRDDPKALDAFKKKYPGTYVVSDKLDGVSALLVYQKGVPTMYTRGDGTYGQNISGLIHRIDAIPKPVGTLATMPLFAVRGELILSKAAWKTLHHKGANARNMVAGTVNAKHPDPDILRALEFVAYEIVEPKQLPSQSFAQLERLKFHVAHPIRLTDQEMTQEVLSRILVERREKSPYECDGIVVRHDAEHRYVTGKNPPYAFAFKSILTHDEAEVIVQRIEWNVSKDGFIKPTLVFAPVVLNGVQIQRATGFNAQYIETHRLGPGARVMIIRSGDVIPHVVRVIHPSDSGTPSMPTMPYEWTSSHVDIVATGSPGEEQQLRSMEFFVQQMNIAYMASGTLQKLYRSGIRTLPQLMHLTEAQLRSIDGIQEKMAKKLYDSLQATRARATCIDYMIASNRFGRGIGRKKIEALVAVYPEMVAGTIPKPPLNAVPGLGASTVEAIVQKWPDVLALIREIDPQLCKQRSVSPKPKPIAALEPLRGKSVVFTGFRENEWEALLQTVEAKVRGTVSKNTNLVVAADPNDDSTKLQKARALKLPIVAKATFQATYRLP